MMPLPPDLITQGTMRTTSGLVLPLEQTEIDATINGPIATVTVKQRFRNSSESPIEAEYMFPLPHGASVHTMRFRIGERTVEGVVKEKEEAKRAYEAARREGTQCNAARAGSTESFYLERREYRATRRH
jgi:hypothetical protein